VIDVLLLAQSQAWTLKQTMRESRITFLSEYNYFEDDIAQKIATLLLIKRSPRGRAGEAIHAESALLTEGTRVSWPRGSQQVGDQPATQDEETHLFMRAPSV
jgi:hypothetical protein